MFVHDPTMNMYTSVFILLLCSQVFCLVSNAINNMIFSISYTTFRLSEYLNILMYKYQQKDEYLAFSKVNVIAIGINYN